MNGAVAEELAGVLEDRADFYLMLAGFYYKPLTQEQIDAMAAQDLSAHESCETLMDEGFDDMRRVLRKRHTGTRRILATEWTSTFGGAEAYKGKYCVPNASVFLDESGSTYGWPRNEASRIYRQRSLRLADNAGMPESHLSFELEFLAVLSREAADCLRAGDAAGALERVDVSRTFVEKSVQSWFPQLKELAFCMLKTRFYKGVLKITEGYLELDCQTLDDLRAEIAPYAGEAGAEAATSEEAAA